MVLGQDGQMAEKQFVTSPSVSPGASDTKNSLSPNISLPRGGGAIRGIGEKFAANPVTGTGSMTVPIATSPGRSGFGPQLSLSYDSGNGNGAFGFGWNLLLPAITRKTEKGLPQYRDAEESDTFLLSSVEDLVPVLDSNGNRFVDSTSFPEYTIHRYSPRIEGLFARIERWTRLSDGDVHWRSISRENILTIYGKDERSRIADPENPSHIFSWLCCETRDDRGNAIIFDYKAEDGTNVDLTQVYERNRGDRNSSLRKANRYLKSVKYGNPIALLDESGQRPHMIPDETLAQIKWMFELVFDYGEHDEHNPNPGDSGAWLCRHDPFSSYRAGFELRTYRLCQRILMFHHFPDEQAVGQDCLVHSIDFAYQNNRDHPDDRKHGHPIASFIASITRSGYQHAAGGGYRKKSLPPLDLEYSQPVISTEVQHVDVTSLENLPVGLAEASYQWVDLYGEGLSGVLMEQADAWFYKPNLGDGSLGPLQVVASRPSLANLRSGQQYLMDLAGEGQLELVQFGRQPAGFFEHDQTQNWEHFVPFAALPNLDWSNPNLQLIDLTGDGLADILLVEDEVFTWYASLAKTGFSPAERLCQPDDEERGPRLVFADGTQTIFLADMSGDMLTDLVRISNGEVCYWPNLGYGRFGSKVTMENSPWFDEPEQFDPRRVRLADIDGSGLTDILYLGDAAIQFWFNQAGNSWGEAQLLPDFPHIENVSSVQVIDLLGNGTACVVWSSPLPGDAGQSMRYIDLMGGHKPHLLVKVTNNLGLETRIHYAASTKFYLADKLASKPWVTHLPFPVQVVEHVEVLDRVSRHRFASHYSYHHGYFDGVEREFRGFGMVERQDTEAFEDYVVGVKHIEGNQELAPELYQPPVTTRTWFHTGVFLERDLILHQLREEYYQQKQYTPEPTFPPKMDEEEFRECVRALKGLPLRQEVYSFDGSAQQKHPYSVVENNYAVQLLQARGKQRNAVCLAASSETVTALLERNSADPRMAHHFTLEIDRYGHVVKSASVVYGRKVTNPALPAEVTRDQQKLSITYGEVGYTPDIDQMQPVPAYRLRVPYASRSYEITGITPGSELFSLKTLKDQIASTLPISYEVVADTITQQKRLLSHTQKLFLGNDLNPLSPGQWDTLALEYASYQLAFTPSVVNTYYAGKVADADFIKAGYVHFNGDNNWWIPSTTAIYPSNPADHFYLPIGSRDPLGVETIVTFDKYNLLAERVQMQQATWNVVSAVNDYRVLGPVMMTDANKNRSAVELDELGMVVKSTIMGKEGAGEGDTLADPTVRMEYELFNWMNNAQPNFVHILAREQHGAGNPRWQEGYAYSNGSGTVAMVKAQAHPGKALQVNPDGTTTGVNADPRWVGNGRIIVNNKGNPVKQYEPYFSTTHEYEDEKALREIGSTPIVYYDPLGRNIRTAFPDGTFAFRTFDPWMQQIFDANDTVKQSKWYADRGSPDPAVDPEPLNEPERRAAWLAARHANTPGTIHFDSLGRPVYIIADYGSGKTAALRTESDLTRRYTTAFDQKQRAISSGFTGMAGSPIFDESAEKGRSWTFVDVLGGLVKTWDEHGRMFRSEYDTLHRPLSGFVQEAGQSELLLTYIVYGDRHPNAEQLNLLGTAHLLFDQAGMIRVPKVDFKGNASSVERVLAKDYTKNPDWSALKGLSDYSSLQTTANLSLEVGEVFSASATFDALNRPTRATLPDGTVMVPAYNQANFLASLQVQMRGQGAFTEFLKGQDYDAKGQRQFAHYGNEVFTRYFYDPKTFRLTNLLTYKSGDDPNTQGLQNLHYAYDPVGNVTQVRDDAQQTRYFSNAVVKPEARYEYDAIYQLIRATGREHAVQTNNVVRDRNDLAPVSQIPHVNDSTAVRTYTELYEYDLLGNITKMQHIPTGTGTAWTRHYHYVYEDDATNRTNHLKSSSNPGDPDGGPYSDTYSYDNYGNMVGMPQISTLAWDSMDQLQRVELGGGGRAYYVYDSGGQRIRKVLERQGSLRVERIYLGPLEIYRERTGNNAPHFERQTVYISDNTGRIAQVDTKTRDQTTSDPTNPLNTPLIRYQYGNHLGSAMLETNSNGDVISYEEYHPYGTTAYRSGKSGVDLSLKRYRFSGKERDDETGLYYFGARYYAPWLGRWTSSDPAGFVDGTNLYRYCSNNPIMLRDPNGMQGNVGDVATTPETEHLRDKSKEAEAKAYLERVYTTRLKPEHRSERVVIDKMHFKKATRKWIVDKWHLVPLDPGGGSPGTDGGTAGGETEGAPDATAPDGPDGGTDASANGNNPNASPDGGTDASKAGDASGSPGGSPQGSPQGSPDGSPQGKPGGSPGGSPTGQAGGSGNGPPRERSFWDRGGRTLLLGLGILALGLLTVATGGGALVMFAAGMAIGAGAATAVGSGILLTASYTGHTTAQEDRRWSEALSDAALVASSPGSAIGGGIGYAVNGREGMRTGALIGGVAEGVASLGVAGVRAAGMKAGPGIAESAGEVTLQQWRQMTSQQRKMYEWGQLTVRSHVWEKMGELGIQGNPIAKGRFLSQTFGGRMGILWRAWNPFLLKTTWGTGLTPMGAYLAPALMHGLSGIAVPLAAYVTHELSQ